MHIVVSIICRDINKPQHYIILSVQKGFEKTNTKISKKAEKIYEARILTKTDTPDTKLTLTRRH